ncbi:MAG: efflux RND transporter periplasmic adaptor subunit [Deltaproteobacteria bacterium]|nr:efflux RND transporter periplasmic adaptor subunit [Deltaproteobacteria bacterium]
MTSAQTASAPRRRELERDLSRVEGRGRWLRLALILVLVAAAITAIAVWRLKTQAPPKPRYLMQPASRGDVIETVQSTGTVQPLTQVQVGAQVSGRLVRVLADYNTEVKKGDLLAEIDPTLYGAQVAQNSAQIDGAKANLARADANSRTAKINLERAKKLFAENLASQADVDAAQGQYDAILADVAASRATIQQISAQLRSSRTNLKYTQIFAPIDGIVISRNIDPGQTVAASFQAPTLFVIAQDLREMRIMADIDEADVGKLAEGMVAEATVDAFPGEIFKGRVRQIRYSPNTVQGVVTYSAVVDVENPEKKLRPGMTATVTVRTHEAKGVVRIPNSSLRFKPSPPVGSDGKPEPVVPLPALPHGKSRVYVLGDATPGKERLDIREIEVGITDGVNTEIKNQSLAEGVQVVVDETDQTLKKQARRNMF